MQRILGGRRHGTTDTMLTKHTASMVMNLLQTIPGGIAENGIALSVGTSMTKRETPKLRDYQESIVNEVLSLFEAGYRGVLTVLPTGMGKTVIAAAGIDRFLSGNQDYRVLVLSHRIELVRQAGLAIANATGRVVGYEYPGRQSEEWHRVVVGSKDSVRTDRRLTRLSQQRFDRIIIDEAHHSEARSYLTIVSRFPTAQFWGLTATPDRFDRRGLSCFDAATTPFTL